MLDHADAECWDDAVWEATPDAHMGCSDSITLPGPVILAVNGELEYLADQLDDTWSKRILCGIGGFLLGAGVGGYLTLDHMRMKAEHARPPAIERGGMRPVEQP